MPHWQTHLLCCFTLFIVTLANILLERNDRFVPHSHPIRPCTNWSANITLPSNKTIMENIIIRDKSGKYQQHIPPIPPPLPFSPVQPDMLLTMSSCPPMPESLPKSPTPQNTHKFIKQKQYIR